MKISVIIPAHNSEKYVGTAIESCLAQTYAPHEIIVADDASTDSTVEIASSYGERVRIVRLLENQGPSGARNAAIKTAVGDWLAFLDADDWFLPDKLAQQRQCALKNGEAILVYSGFRTSLNGVEVPARFRPPIVLWPMLRYRCAMLISTVILRRDVFDSIGGFDPILRGVEDWDLFVRLARRYSVQAFAAVPEPLTIYRVTPGSLSSDAERTFNRHASLMEKRLLDGTSGLPRVAWRRWISAFQHYDAALALRHEGSRLDLRFLVRSLLLWPFPNSLLPLRRYKVFASMVLQHLRRT